MDIRGRPAVAGAAGQRMMNRFSKMRPGLLVAMAPGGFRSMASRRSTRPFVPNEVITSPVCALIAVTAP
jgi:hypothetical protein